MSAFFNLRTVTTTDTSTLEDIAATLSRNYPHLTINSVPKTRTEWIVVHRPDMIIFSPDYRAELSVLRQLVDSQKSDLPPAITIQDRGHMTFATLSLFLLLRMLLLT